MAKKDNTMLYVLVGAAVIGYFALKYYDKNLLSKSTSGNSSAGILLPQGPIAGSGDVLPGIATEIPNETDIGIYFPSAPLTGQSITFL